MKHFEGTTKSLDRKHFDEEDTTSDHVSHIYQDSVRQQWLMNLIENFPALRRSTNAKRLLEQYNERMNWQPLAYIVTHIFSENVQSLVINHTEGDERLGVGTGCIANGILASYTSGSDFDATIVTQTAFRELKRVELQVSSSISTYIRLGHATIYFGLPSLRYIWIDKLQEVFFGWSDGTMFYPDPKKHHFQAKTLILRDCGLYQDILKNLLLCFSQVKVFEYNRQMPKDDDMPFPDPIDIKRGLERSKKTLKKIVVRGNIDERWSQVHVFPDEGQMFTVDKQYENLR